MTTIPVIECPECGSQLGVNRGARLEHNEDGSHDVIFADDLPVGEFSMSSETFDDDTIHANGAQQ